MSDVEELSTTDALEAAWDQYDDSNDTNGSDESAVSAKPAKLSEDDGDAESSGDEWGNGAADAAAVQESNQPSEPQRQAEAGSLHVAPKGLPPQAREDWANVPDSVKEYVGKFEQRMAGLHQKYGRDAERAAAMDRSLSQFQPLFSANGGPANVLPGLLQTATVLQMGAGPQKAQAVANIIKQFGVDIRTLDALLVGEQPEPNPNHQFEEMLNQRLGPLQQQLQGYQQREQFAQQQAQQNIQNELAQFAQKNEFYNDLRTEMADIMDLAANRGQELTLQEAYDKACQLNPQISQILAARRNTASTAQKRRAASSINGRIGGDGSGGGQAGSISDILNQAWDNAGRA